MAMDGVFIFVLLRVASGDPAGDIAGPVATEEVIAKIREQLGLHEPLPVQFVNWLTGMLHGDSGNSIFLGRLVLELLASCSGLAPKFYPVLSSLRRFWVAVFGAVAAGCGAEPFRLRSTASRRGLMV